MPSDISKYGPGLKGLDGLSERERLLKKAEENRLRVNKNYHNPESTASQYSPDPVRNIGVEAMLAGVGESTYDQGITSTQLSSDALSEYRAQEQPWYAQLSAGLLKGVGLAGTTFLDGTAGLIAGLVQGFSNLADNDENTGFWEGMYNNSVSKTLREFNTTMEEILPNYRTKDEIENPWALRNVFSMNTIADDFLKNIGFTVGAFYSGNAYLGALRALGAAGAMGSTAAKLIGSTLSGINEGRIEAGNQYDEIIKSQMPVLKDAYDNYQAELQAIQAEPDQLIQLDNGAVVSTKAQKLLRAKENYEALEQDIKNRAAAAANTTLLFNSIYLPFTDYYAYGKLYGRKFKPKNDLAKGVEKEAAGAATNSIDNIAAREAAEEAIGSKVTREGGRYKLNPTTVKQAAWRGFKTGLSEGAEEMNQAWFSSGTTATYMPDSPDAYYEALKNEKAEIETKDGLTGLLEGFKDSWGNADTYKEGLIGFLTGIIGMPTFGKVNNSDYSTYLGRGSFIGLSQGLLGEISRSREYNRQAQEAVDTMNSFIDRRERAKIENKVANAERFFITGTSFNDAMDGYSEEGNQFEFNNYADNSLFNAIDAFARTGRLSDLRELVDQDFDNISDEEVVDILNSAKSEEWKDTDGSPLQNTPEGRQKARRILNERKQEILNGIKAYEDSLGKVRAISNNSLTEDQTAELAWLDWKIGKFNNRYGSIREENKDLFKNMSDALLARRDELERSIDPNVKEDEDNIAAKELKSVNNLLSFVNAAQGAKSALELGAIINANPKFLEFFQGSETQSATSERTGITYSAENNYGYESVGGNKLGVSFSSFKDSMEKLSDMGKMSTAAQTFNERYKEFSQNPLALIQNRENIDKEHEERNNAKNRTKLNDQIDNASIPDLVNAIENQELPPGIQSILNNDGVNPPTDIDQDRASKLQQAQAIIDKVNRMEEAIRGMAGVEGVDYQAIEDAVALLEKQKQLSTSADQIGDTNSEVWNDIQNLTQTAEQQMTDQAKAVSSLEDRLSKAAALAVQAEALLAEQDQQLDGVPDVQDTPAPAPTPTPQPVGHDSNTPTPPVNQAAPRSQQPQQSQQYAYKDEAEKVIRETGVAVQPANLDSLTRAIASMLQSIDDMVDKNVPVRDIANTLEQTGSFTTAVHLLGRQTVQNIVNQRVNSKRASNSQVQEATPNNNHIEEAKRIADKEDIPKKMRGAFGQFMPTVLATMDALTASGYTLQQVGQMLTKTQAFKALGQLFKGGGGQERVKQILNHRTAPRTTGSNSISANTRQNEATTPIILGDINAIEQQIEQESERQYSHRPSRTEPLNYWKPTLMEYEPRPTRGDFKTFIEWATSASCPVKFSEQQMRRMKAVYKFLTDHNSFAIVNNGAAEVGNTIHFITSKKLNEDAGESVILMVDSQGRVLGDLGSLNDILVERQIDLVDFLKEKEKEIKEKETKSSDDIIQLEGETTVLQNMVGKVPYTNQDDRHTLNEIWEGQPFKLAIAEASGSNPTMVGSATQAGRMPWEEQILAPLSATAGQPFVLVETTDPKRKYVCVPFTMPSLNIATANSQLARVLRQRLKDGIDRKDWKRIKEAIMEILAVESCGVKFKDNGKLWIGVKVNGRNVSLGDMDIDSNTTNTIMEKLIHADNVAGINIPFQINIKYINDTIMGRNYNQMVGELASTNLPIGATHTVQEWFTVNPVGQKGKEQPTEGINPNKKEKPVRIPVSYGNTIFEVDPKSWKVFDSKGMEVTGPVGMVISAYAQCARNYSTTEEGPFNTTKGWFNPVKMVFVEAPKTQEKKPASVSANSKTPQPDTTSKSSNQQRQDERIKEAVSNLRDKFNSQYRNPIDENALNAVLKDLLELKVGKEDSIESIRDKVIGIFTRHGLGKVGNNLDAFGGYRQFTGPIIAKANEEVAIIQGAIGGLVDGLKEAIARDGAKAREKDVIKWFTDHKNDVIDTIKRLHIATVEDFVSYLVNNAKNEQNKRQWENDLRFDSVRDLIQQYIHEINQSSNQSSEPTDQQLNEDIQSIIGKDKLSNAVYDRLTKQQKIALYNKKGIAKKQTWDRIKIAAANKRGSFEDKVNEILNSKPKFSKEGTREYDRKWNEKKERRWLARALPQLNQDEKLRIHKGLIKISEEDDADYAYGQFLEGVITISDEAARGTLYHEAFHLVFNTLLSDTEQDTLFNEAYKFYGITNPLEVEENLAEDFRKYVQREEIPVIGKIIRLFRTIKHIVQSIKGKEPYINKVFYNINRGKYVNRVQRSTSASRYATNGEELESIRREMEEIKQRAIANGTFMKAPNGQPTKLNERQWLQVRTKAFKEWFGDWENDPENASKVVDENGEPLVVYHGTTSDINVFDLNRNTANVAWFTTDKEYAEHYAKKNNSDIIKEVFLNIRNPYGDFNDFDALDDLHTAMIPMYKEEASFSGVTPDGFIGHDTYSGTKRSNGYEIAIVNPNQIKSATDNIGTFSTTNPDIRYRRVERSQQEKEKILKEDLKKFLDNFAIDIKDVSEYEGSEPLFNALDRVINFTSIDDLTDEAGYAMAFMMQHNEAMKKLISLKVNYGSSTGKLARGLRSITKKGEDAFIPSLPSSVDKQAALKEIGKEIASELRKLYEVDTEERPSFLQKVWDVITSFFEMLTPNSKKMFSAIKQYTTHIANSVKIGDTTLIINGMIKPKTTEEAVRVDVGTALRENPYEESIIKFFSDRGIALAGSASIALFGTLYRPQENPLHDIDFQAATFDREKLDTLIDELSPYNTHIRTIQKGVNEATETYLIMDRTFSEKNVIITDDKGKKKNIKELYDNNNNLIGTLIGSELVLKEGVKGKLLDFFVGKSQSPYGFNSMTINGKRYLISDPRNAFNAKLDWQREKDIWDYNRYVPNTRIMTVKDVNAQNKEIQDRVRNAKIIWGHPAIGKTTYLEAHKDEILEWDAEVNPRRFEFIKSQIDPEGVMSEKEFESKRQEYMAEWDSHPEYIEFITKEWESLKRRAERENKQIFASPTPLLGLFMQDFDLIINLTTQAFMKNNMGRGGRYYSSLDWKEAIDRLLVKADPGRLITTDQFFSQIMGESQERMQQIIEQHHRDKLMYSNLSDEDKQYLEDRKITIEEYNRMSTAEKEVLFRCKS